MTQPTPPKDIFVSYSRTDADFARQLAADLDALSFTLWRDRSDMQIGDDWWLQIEAAIKGSQNMVLIMSPAALASPTVRKEWRYARHQGTRVLPVIARDIDFGAVPRWMKTADWVDFRPEGVPNENERRIIYARFIAQLKAPYQPRRVPFMPTDPPADFVMRQDEYEAIIAPLLDVDQENPVVITTAIQGAGGYGKTTLARAICHDDRIIDAFDDGVLWIEFGETPGDLTGYFHDLIEEFSGERPQYENISSAQAALRELFTERDVLLVIDDVWSRDHLYPFTALQKHVTILITTRFANVLPIDTESINVDRMQESEAVQMLGAGLSLDGAQNGALAVWAERLGYWPLLLKLVNGFLRTEMDTYQQSFEAALTVVNESWEHYGITAFDDPDSETLREAAVSATLAPSLYRLDESTERPRYAELAIFPEDIDIPLATIERLWRKTGNLPPIGVRRLLQRLHGMSLLLDLDLNARTARFHDVIRHYLRSENKAKLPHWNRTLLDSYGVERWADLPPDEPYLWDYLAYHLVEAKREEALVATVKDAMYLCAKTLARDTVGAEKDLVVAEEHAPEDRELAVLTRHFANAGHLLNRSETMRDALATLHSRLTHIPELATVSTTLHTDLQHPCLTARHQLPDLPHPALIRTLAGHGDRINACAVSPDGRTIVSASADQTLKVWEAATGTCLTTLHVDAALWCCAWSPDGETIVAGGGGGHVYFLRWVGP